MRNPAPLALLLPLSLAVAGCGPSKQYTTADVPSLSKFDDLMWAQAQAADPAFKRIGQATLADDDFAAATKAAERLKATAPRLKEKGFTKGAEFDALADQLGAKADALGAASAAKDSAKTVAALSEVKDTCRACHKKFR